MCKISRSLTQLQFIPGVLILNNSEAQFADVAVANFLAEVKVSLVNPELATSPPVCP